MIKYPDNWKGIGNSPSLTVLDEILLETVRNLGCANLSLSGGIDSSLMLFYMSKVFGSKVKCFNIACSDEHPDYIFSELVSRYFGVDCFHYVPDIVEEDDGSGNGIVSAFYSNLSSFHHVDSIIACDGIDELMGGYYEHARLANNEIFFHYLSRLQDDQLGPLDKNSGDIEVLLPYLSTKFINAVSYIPLSERFGSGYRKKIIYELAKGRIPDKVIERRKYGFVDAMIIKEDTYEAV